MYKKSDCVLMVFTLFIEGVLLSIHNSLPFWFLLTVTIIIVTIFTTISHRICRMMLIHKIFMSSLGTCIANDMKLYKLWRTFCKENRIDRII